MCVCFLACQYGNSPEANQNLNPLNPYSLSLQLLLSQVWSVGLRRFTRTMKIDSAARSLAFSPSGNHLAVGLGGDRDAMVKEGAVVILSVDTLEVLEEVR